MDRRYISEEFAAIGHQLIEEMPELAYLRGADITIVFLESEHKKKAKGKIVHAVCEKVAEKYKWSIPADFTITVFLPNCEKMDDEQMRILLLHELLHIGQINEVWSIVPHDLEDFRTIIRKYGADWDLPKGETGEDEKHHAGE